MREFFFILAAMFMVDVALAKSSLKTLERKVQVSRTEISELKGSIKTITDLRVSLEGELRNQESEFQEKFTKVIVPLLAWPDFSLNSQRVSWAEREQGRFLLEELRQKLLEEPLRLMADREMNLRTAIQLQTEFESRMKNLEARQNLLNLQLEELKILQRKSNKKANKP